MVEKEYRKCEFCGEFFEANRNRKFCCAECRRKNDNLTKKIRVNKDRNAQVVKNMQAGLVHDAVEAKRLGMTYGQYKGMQYLQQERGAKRR